MGNSSSVYRCRKTWFNREYLLQKHSLQVFIQGLQNGHDLKFFYESEFFV